MLGERNLGTGYTIDCLVLGADIMSNDFCYDIGYARAFTTISRHSNLYDVKKLPFPNKTDLGGAASSISTNGGVVFANQDVYVQVSVY